LAPASLSYSTPSPPGSALSKTAVRRRGGQGVRRMGLIRSYLTSHSGWRQLSEGTEQRNLDAR